VCPGPSDIAPDRVKRLLEAVAVGDVGVGTRLQYVPVHAHDQVPGMLRAGGRDERRERRRCRFCGIGDFQEVLVQDLVSLSAAIVGSARDVLAQQPYIRGLLTGQNRGPQPGHLRILSHGHGHVRTSMNHFQGSVPPTRPGGTEHHHVQVRTARQTAPAEWARKRPACRMSTRPPATTTSTGLHA
jgi:hypothetical protein